MKLLNSLVASLTFSSVAFANPHTPADSCEEKFSSRATGEIPGYEEVLIHGSRHAPNAEEFEKALAQVREISYQLGLFRGINRHVAEILSPVTVASLAVTNRYPVGAPSDGAVIARQAAQMSGVLEFVLSGKLTQHSYYLSTLDLTEFLSIVIHVYGHNFFHVHSYFPHKTSADRVGISYDLDQFMDQMSKVVHPHEVEDWFFKLLSLEHAQDYWSGLYVTPKDMEPKTDPVEFREWAGGLQRSENSKGRQTQSIFQAFIAELPRSTPAWKIEMAKKVEAMNRFIPGAISTKVVNEGFATICQEIVFEHMPEELRQFANASQLGQMMAGVTYPSKTNPYFVGVEIWRSIRAEFNQRPEIAKLTPMERDHAFFEYAEKEYIHNPNLGNNIDFIKEKMTDSWIKNRHLALVKKYSSEEVAALTYSGKIPTPAKWPAELYQVITHDPDRIRQQFAADWDWYRAYPFVTWKNLQAEGDDVARFEVGGDMGMLTPISRQTLGPALLTWSQMLRKKVELEATLLEGLAQTQTHRFGAGSGNKVQGYHLVRAKVSVNAQGNIEVVPLKTIKILGATTLYGFSEPTRLPSRMEISDIKPDDPISREIAARQAMMLKKYLEAFQKDYNLDRNEPTGEVLVEFPNDKEQRQSELIRSALSAQSNALVSSLALNEIPSGVIRAVAAYDQKIARRFLASFKAALGAGKLNPSAAGIQLKVLPSAPVISFDRRAQGVLKKMLTDISHPLNPYHKDDGLIFQSNPRQDGSLYWKSKEEQGQGQGQGSGDEGDDGEESDESGTDEDGEKKQKPGQGKGGGMDPTYVQVPYELYNKLVSEEIELPNLRPLKGDSERMKRIQSGSRVGDQRPLAIKKTAKRLMSLGLGIQANAEEEGITLDEEDLLELGIEIAQRSDIRTKASVLKPDPDISAHVTVVADNSGSMMDNLDKLRNMFFNLRALLKHKYKSVIFTYIAFDGKAHVFQDDEEDKFFKVHLGGGTDYAIGTEEVLNVHKKFPEGEYDRFVLVAGDLYESMNDRVKTATEQVKNQSRFFGVIKFPLGPGVGSTGGLEDYYVSLAKADDFAGFAEVAYGEDYNLITTFKTLFKTDAKKKK